MSDLESTPQTYDEERLKSYVQSAPPDETSIHPSEKAQKTYGEGWQDGVDYVEARLQREAVFAEKARREEAVSVEQWAQSAIIGVKGRLDQLVGQVAALCSGFRDLGDGLEKLNRSVWLLSQLPDKPKRRKARKVKAKAKTVKRAKKTVKRGRGRPRKKQ